jgi:poly(glycerol-phosphate) alpha-glucosyltransferase
LSSSKTVVEALGLEDGRFSLDQGQWPVPARVLPVLGPATFGYAPGLARALQRLDPDLLHLHGLWMYPSVAAAAWARRLRRPLLISPHGMLDPWALRHSGWKKALATWAYERRSWQVAACFHALNLQELDAIRAAGIRGPVAVIPNGVDLPDTPPDPGRRSRCPRRLLFLGRLHPKKNVLGLLQAWNALGPLARRGWQLSIAGWGDRAYRQRLTKEAGEDVQILGAQFGPSKEELWEQASAFVLPSFSEGLPMAVLEAWAQRLPVLMSRECNLDAGFGSGAAVESGTSVKELTASLERFLGMTGPDLLAMGGRGRTLVEASFSWPSVTSRWMAVHQWLLGRAPKPDEVDG